jgi:hypothetical protein
MLDAELVAVREDRRSYARLDTEAMVSAAARRSAFRDAAHDLAHELAHRLGAAPRGALLEETLAHIRSLGQVLREEERLNEELQARVRALVDGYVNALLPTEGVAYGRSGRVPRANPEYTAGSRVSRRT